MDNIIKKLKAQKKEYREHMERVQALPEDYQYVFSKMQGYMWSFIGGDGMDMLKTQYGLIELFEIGAQNSQHVLDVTGEDVASFCDELIRGNRLWMDRQRRKLNRKISSL